VLYFKSEQTLKAFLISLSVSMLEHRSACFQ